MIYSIFDIEKNFFDIDKNTIFVIKKITMIGIYAIKNKVNGKMYIGSSNNIERRFKRHKTELNTGKHSNSHLSLAFKKFGRDSFDFLILEICTQDELINKEIEYISKYNTLDSNLGYNMCIPRLHPSIQSSLVYSNLLSISKKGITPINHKDMQRIRWKKIEVFKDGVPIKVCDSCYETERFLGIKRGNLYNYLKGNTKKIRGYENYNFKEV